MALSVLGVAARAGGGSRPSYALLAGLLLVAGLAALAWLRRHGDSVGVAVAIRRWAQAAEAVGLAGSRLIDTRADRAGWTFYLELQPGQTVEDANRQIKRLESALRVRPDSVRVVRARERADRCVVRVVRNDPLARVIPWPGPRIQSVSAPIPLGLFEDGSEVVLPLAVAPGHGQHVLIAGIKGSGKSGLLHVIIGSLVNCQDCAVWAIDLFAGKELGLWGSRLARLAMTVPEAIGLLDAANHEIAVRARTLASRHTRSWEPSPREPLIVIVADEVTDLHGQLGPMYEVARKGRAVGVLLVVATQRPSAEALGEGGTALRSQIDIAICLRVSRPEEIDIVLGRGMAGEGWRPDRLTAGPGSFLIAGAGYPLARPARAYHMRDQDIENPYLAVERQVARDHGRFQRNSVTQYINRATWVNLAHDIHSECARMVRWIWGG